MTTRQPLYKSLYVQVIVAIAIGILLGHYYPETGVALKPLGDGFIKLIKMVIAPIYGRVSAISPAENPPKGGNPPNIVLQDLADISYAIR